jgi:hypothetical protein
VFIVKGVNVAYGTFTGGDEDGYGSANYRHARQQFDTLKRLGVNTVRIMTQASNNDPRHKRLLRTVVTWARHRHFVVEIATAYSTAMAALPWLRYLAHTYKDDPYVWLLPMNEPNCAPPGNVNRCYDWLYWQVEENAYIKIIRDAGMRSPIVVNTVSWSWDLSQIAQYPLDDPNIIYGVHRYANDTLTFNANERAFCDEYWANLAGMYPIIVDEFGAYDGPTMKNRFAWVEGFVDYITTWVNNENGDGAIAFSWHWSDANSMTAPSGNLNGWGMLFVDRYLRQVKAPVESIGNAPAR